MIIAATYYMAADDIYKKTASYKIEQRRSSVKNGRFGSKCSHINNREAYFKACK